MYKKEETEEEKKEEEKEEEINNEEDNKDENKDENKEDNKEEKNEENEEEKNEENNEEKKEQNKKLEEEIKEQNEDKNEKEINEDNNLENPEKKQENILSYINEIIELNNKVQNDTFNVIKRTNHQIYDKIIPEKLIEIIESNNKRVVSYKLFCLYTNYDENSSFMTKKKDPKKFYFNYWHKKLNEKIDE